MTEPQPTPHRAAPSMDELLAEAKAATLDLQRAALRLNAAMAALQTRCIVEKSR